MIINISSGQSGWSEYVLNGTRNKPRDKNLVRVLDGDTKLGDILSETNKYEDSYYKIVLGFKGKPDEKVILQAYKDFKDNFFTGLNEDEYHIDAVIHYDTDDTHIHCRIPKQNLLTNTHLQLYYDKVDKPRKQLIQDYISLKYGFEIARETNREIVKEESQEYIEKWRAEHNQKPISFKTKKERATAELAINNYIKELIESEYIQSKEDIKEVLESLDLKVIKFNKDLKKDFSYVTVQNDENEKIRIKGEFYNEQFWRYSTEDRTEQIKNNQRIQEGRGGNNNRLEAVERELKKANAKRFKRCTELFAKSRERARKQSSKISINREETARNKQGDISLQTRTDGATKADMVDKHKHSSNNGVNSTSLLNDTKANANERVGNTTTNATDTQGQEVYKDTNQSATSKRRQQHNIHTTGGIKEDDSTRAILERRKRKARKRTTEELRKRIAKNEQELYEKLARSSKQLQDRARKNNGRKREERARTIRKLHEQLKSNFKGFSTTVRKVANTIKNYVAQKVQKLLDLQKKNLQISKSVETKSPRLSSEDIAVANKFIEENRNLMNKALAKNKEATPTKQQTITQSANEDTPTKEIKQKIKANRNR